MTKKILFYVFAAIFTLCTAAVVMLLVDGVSAGPAGIAFAFLSIPFTIGAVVAGLICASLHKTLYSQPTAIDRIINVIFYIPALYAASIFLYPLLFPILETYSFLGPVNLTIIIGVVIFVVWFFFFRKKKL